MNNQLVIRTYEAEGRRIAVPFTDEAYFNATEVAKAFGKRPNDWLSLPETQRYLDAVKTIILPGQNHLPDFLVNQINTLVITKRGPSAFEGGTWLHPKLAVPFARWLDVRFAIWCDLQIDDILRRPAGAGEVNIRLVMALEQMTGLLQRMVADPVSTARPAPASSQSVPEWIRDMQIVVEDIADNIYSFPFQFKNVHRRDCLLIKCTHIAEHLALQHDLTVTGRSLKRQLINARVVVSNRRDPVIQRDRFYHFLALDLAAMEQRGVQVPWMESR